MKQFLSLFIVIAMHAEGARAVENQLPADAALLFQTYGSSTNKNLIGAPEESIAVDSAIYRMKQEQDKFPNLDLSCQAIYRKWSESTTHSESAVRTGCVVFGGCEQRRHIIVNVYCQPRPLQQQQVVSLVKACEKDPKEECFKKEFLEYLNNYQPTKYYDINKPG